MRFLIFVLAFLPLFATAQEDRLVCKSLPGEPFAQFEIQSPVLTAQNPTDLSTPVFIDGGVEIVTSPDQEDSSTGESSPLDVSTKSDLGIQTLHIEYSEPDGTKWKYDRLVRGHGTQSMPETLRDPSKYTVQFEGPDLDLTIYSFDNRFQKVEAAQVTMPEINHGMSQDLQCEIKSVPGSNF